MVLENSIIDISISDVHLTHGPSSKIYELCDNINDIEPRNVYITGDISGYSTLTMYLSLLRQNINKKSNEEL